MDDALEAQELADADRRHAEAERLAKFTGESPHPVRVKDRRWNETAALATRTAEHPHPSNGG